MPLLRELGHGYPYWQLPSSRSQQPPRDGAGIDSFAGKPLALRKYASTEPSLRVSPDSILWALRKIEAEYAKGLRTSSFLTPLSQTREELERLRMLRQEEQKRRAAALAARKAKAEPRVTYYKVRRGDVLGRIAQRNHCTVKQLKAWNNLKSDNIREGQRLKIYSR